MTKQEQRNAAWEAFRPALKAFRAEIKKIENEPDEDIIEQNGKRYKLIE